MKLKALWLVMVFLIFISCGNSSETDDEGFNNQNNNGNSSGNGDVSGNEEDDLPDAATNDDLPTPGNDPAEEPDNDGKPEPEPGIETIP